MTKKLHIAPSLSLPLDAATSTIVVYGGKGMGKTNLATVLVEEFASAGIRFAVIDPMGVWWGLRHSADGKGPGIKVLILGGIHGDLPISPESGALVADLVVDEDASVIIDISRRADGSMWAIAERIRFVTAYAKRLYQRQGEKRRPVNQVIDEAARFAPQIVRQGENEVAACMGAIAVLVEEGRNVGIGVVLVTQRSARLNKDVAELADCMIAFRIVGPNSMRAVLDWLGEHIEKARLKDIGEKLRSLPRGSALVVSPGWLEFEGIVAMRKRETFDSSATPKAGAQVRASGAGAKLDLAKYRERLADLVEQQRANDPKQLRARIAELERGATHAKVETKVVEKPILDEKLVRVLKDTILALEHRIVPLGTELQQVLAELGQVKRALHIAEAWASSPRRPTQAPPPPRPAAAKRLTDHPPELAPHRKANGHAPTTLPIGEVKTLEALIAYPAGLTRSQLRVLTAYKRSSSDAYIARLREKGLVEADGERVRATTEGVAARPNAQPLPVGEDLRRFWFDKLPEGERRVLEILCQVYPEPIERPSIDESTGYQRSSRDAYLARLAAKELVVQVGRGAVRACDALFEGGVA